MSVLDNLYLYEIVLLILGILLFVTALGLTIYRSVKGEISKNLIYLFALAVIMIAYPSIQSFSVAGGLLDLEKQSQAVEDNPNDSKAQEALSNTLGKLESRPISSKTSTMIARGYVALGDTTTAIRRLDSLIRISPNTREAKILRSRLPK